MKKKNRIILCLCSIFVLITSIFSFIPLAKDTHIVKADSVSSDYSFSGSNISSKTTFTNGLFSYNLFDINYQGAFSSNSYKRVSQHLFLLSEYSEPLNIDINGNEYTFSRGNVGDILTNFKFVNLIPNTVYRFSFIPVSVSDSSIRFHFGTKYDIQNSLGSTIFTSFTSDENGEYIFRYGIWIQSRNNSFTVKDVMLHEGNYSLPYQPYQDSTQVNYQFNISSLFDLDYLYSSVDITFDISNQYKYTHVSNNNSNIDYGLKYSTGNGALNAGGVMGLVQYFTFSAYDLVGDNRVLNNDYIFKLYFFFDYLDIDGYDRNTAFISNVSSIVLGSYKNRSYFNNEYSLNDDFLDNNRYNFISYVDSNYNSINFLIPLESNIESDYWDFRTYYTSNSSTDSTSSFNNGYSSGYNIGYDKGNREGYDKGYKLGNTTGYNNGYNAGVQAGNDYTFLSLVSSVIDAPMTYFTSLFNFELLGVNLQGFLMALFTLCVVVTIVKLCLGR